MLWISPPADHDGKTKKRPELLENSRTGHACRLMPRPALNSSLEDFYPTTIHHKEAFLGLRF
jgi:hypothetical protein